MKDKLQSIIDKYTYLEQQMMDPDIASNVEKITTISKEIKKLESVYFLAKEYLQADHNKQEAEKILAKEKDQDMKDLAQEQYNEALTTISNLEEKVKLMLLPKDQHDDKNIYLEIRPAAGGDEAGLFAGELLRAYLMYAQHKGRKTEVVEEDLSGIGGLKFGMVKIMGEDVYAHLKRESGVHRVQRVPDTESQGRVHTSTITVAIMPEVDDVQVDIDPNDITLDTFAASSAGGQNANKNQTGVRLHHEPTGLIVTIADNKSQLKNKEKAYNVLKAKIYQMEQEKQAEETQEIRGDQIGSGARSEKIRTYNFPQDRVTDHRIKHSWSNIDGIMGGSLDDIIQTLTVENQAKLLAKVQAQQG